MCCTSMTKDVPMQAAVLHMRSGAPVQRHLHPRNGLRAAYGLRARARFGPGRNDGGD